MPLMTVIPCPGERISRLVKSGVAFAAILLSVDSIAGQCPSALPNPLPLNGTWNANTCSDVGNTPCSETVYPERISTSLLVLDTPTDVTLVTVPADTLMIPILYVSGGVCDSMPCRLEAGTRPSSVTLPAGNYCLTVTSAPFIPAGVCGCFTLYAESTPVDLIFTDGFESAADR